MVVLLLVHETLFLAIKIVGTRFLPPSILLKWRGLRGLEERRHRAEQVERPDLRVGEAARGMQERRQELEERRTRSATSRSSATSKKSLLHWSLERLQGSEWRLGRFK